MIDFVFLLQAHGRHVCIVYVVVSVCSLLQWKAVFANHASHKRHFKSRAEIIGYQWCVSLICCILASIYIDNHLENSSIYIVV